ncbi:TPA: hypothetical protein I0F65_RS04685 [Enterococcus faecalis]|nr:hypothetical protein [Enterococcus faecalis]HBI1661740.1 hypothetical protein [Enterococcus faecalis]HBI1690484.1 hypothetical protein [Enterococcus faecalis]HBI1696336.1 hypothetical protein [Enterococcus faecalis]HBI1699141.1 hypothetical protein [Enterococcus faecalis]
MNRLAIKKYVQNRVKRTFLNANVTISKAVINGLSNELYVEFERLTEKEQEQLVYSDSLVSILWNRHMEKINRELMEET